MIRELSMRRTFALFGSAALFAGAVACSGGGSPTPPRPNDNGSGGSGTGGGSVSNAGSGNMSSGGGGGSTVIGIDTLLKSCGTSSLGQPQLRRLTRGELQRTLDDIFPQVKGKWTVSIPEAESALGFDNDPAVLTVGGQVAGKLLDTATDLASALVADDVLPQVLPCASAANHACAQTFLDQFGRRLFRRPLTQADKDRYLSFFDAQLAASDFKSAIKWLTIGLIQSPHAIYRREVGTLSGGEYQLSPHEIAGELAYMFTGTTPSADLLAQADAGQLDSPEHLTTIAGQLLATPAGQDTLQRFFKGWLSYDQIPSTLPNVSGFGAVAPDMVKETQAFIQQTVLTNRGGLKELLTASYTNPSQALSSFYGLPAPSADYAPVERPTGRGIGVLAQGSLIVAHSHEAASSPTLRGLLVFERLLCGKRPQVPPNVPTLVSASPGVKTTRQRYEEQHMAAGVACAGCHKNFDPLGFGFEHFDEGGRYRAKEGNFDINSAAMAAAPDGSTMSFTDQESLMNDIAGQATIHDCAAAYMATYAFGTNEACIGSSQVSDLRAGKIGLAEAFAKLASEPHFTKRDSQ
ncbi:MAG TPA: DUF1592 domain-containing protein [Polyangiaceae bacterium]|nr:DUF1592 domain-containing protein [Polyangiaceae bacterium]